MNSRGTSIFLAILLVLAVGVMQAPALAANLGAWKTTGSMETARDFYASVLLQDGRVLAVGGRTNGAPEIYDPAIGTWRTTGPLNSNKIHAKANLLMDGRVLVTGGHSTSAEIYDPATGTWSLTGSLSDARHLHDATLLKDGRVLVTGGVYSAIAEIYDPVTGVWSAAGSLLYGRYAHTATLLPDGRVLVAGGGPESCEIYDPSTETWSTTGSLGAGRTFHSATLLQDGKVLVVGNEAWIYGYVADPEIYDPATGTWRPAASPAASRGCHTATLLSDGRVLVAGGWNIDLGIGTHASCEIYDPSTGTWTPTGSLSYARGNFTATLLNDGKVLVAGGWGPGPYNGGEPLNILASAELFDPRARPPIADAGNDQTIQLGSTVNLNGAGSFDPDGQVPLTYQWRFLSMPEGSNAQLSDPTSVNPSFVTDVFSHDPWILELVISNRLGCKSPPARVKINVTNSAPVADAGSDQAAPAIGSTITLNGSGSYDPDGDPITYQWTFTAYPGDTPPTLTDADTATPSFVAAAHFNYQLMLVVRDGWSDSVPALVKVKFTNVTPAANAGPGQAVVVGATVYLDGSGSTDADGDSLTYRWDLTTKPGDSNLSFGDTTMSPSFYPDVPGSYVVQLIVNDGFEDSPASTVQIQVSTSAAWLSDQIRDVIQTIGMLPTESPLSMSLAAVSAPSSGAFKNKNMRNTMINKLQVIIKQVDTGNYSGALAKLREDVIPKTDGCALGGRPDNNDWVISCTYQAMIYPALMDIAGHLAELERR